MTRKGREPARGSLVTHRITRLEALTTAGSDSAGGAESADETKLPLCAECNHCSHFTYLPGKLLHCCLPSSLPTLVPRHKSPLGSIEAFHTDSVILHRSLARINTILRCNGAISVGDNLSTC